MKLHPNEAVKMAARRYTLDLEVARQIYIQESTPARENFNKRMLEAAKIYDEAKKLNS